MENGELRLLLLSSLTLCLAAGSACESPGDSGEGLFGIDLGGRDTREKWAIRCLRTEGPNHEERCRRLADMLRQVRDLNLRKVRVATDAIGTTIYYGEYVKVPRPETNILVFPPEFQRDIGLIRRLAVNQQPVFGGAKPELIETDKSPGRSEWDVAHAKGTYTLQIGVFYNTPTFHQRRWAAEEYVRILRDEGFNAYYRHQPGRSFVFVGDFDDSDLIGTPPNVRFGPRIERLIAQREQEFRHMLENGHPVKHGDGSGRLVVPPSILTPVPRNEAHR